MRILSYALLKMSGSLIRETNYKLIPSLCVPSCNAYPGTLKERNAFLHIWRWGGEGGPSELDPPSPPSN